MLRHVVTGCALVSAGLSAAAADRMRLPVEAPSAVAMAEAESAYVRGDYERAARLLTTLVEVEQQNAFAWVRLGRALRQRGAYDAAWRAYDRAIELVTGYGDDRDARAVEIEARRGRAAVSIDAALVDVETLPRLTSDPVVAREVRALAVRLQAARATSEQPAGSEPVRKSARASGVVRHRQVGAGATQPAVQVIQGGSGHQH